MNITLIGFSQLGPLARPFLLISFIFINKCVLIWFIFKHYNPFFSPNYSRDVFAHQLCTHNSVLHFMGLHLSLQPITSGSPTPFCDSRKDPTPPICQVSSFTLEAPLFQLVGPTSAQLQPGLSSREVYLRDEGLSCFLLRLLNMV